MQLDLVQESSVPKFPRAPTIGERDADARPSALTAAPAPLRLDLTRGGCVLGEVALAPAVDDALGAEVGDEEHRLARAAALRDVQTDALAREDLALLLYTALRRARVWGCTAALLPAASPAATIELLGAAPLPSRRGRPSALAQRVDVALQRLYRASSPAGQATIRAGFTAEAVAALDRRARAFADNAWCRAVRAGRLGREQYIATLANTHQYVRYTPRLLARAIAASDDEALRDHFTRHLRGEQKHERLIEADLRYLGADVEFVVGAMAPSVPTQAFMVVQESMIGFYQDPIRFMAAPFVAEGLAARVDPTLLPLLADNIRRWGYDRPDKATRFLASHVRADGGDDGHWARTAALLARSIADEAAQQRFLNVVHLAADAFQRSYDAYVEALALWTLPA